jgi:3-hydroxybutyryl-CoA dehydrogenase
MVMTVAILADKELVKEFVAQIGTMAEIIYADSLRSLLIIEADMYFDFEFSEDAERIGRLKALASKPVFVNAVDTPRSLLGNSLIRFNGWPTMAGRSRLEVSAAPEMEATLMKLEEEGLPVVRVPDMIGMVTPLIVSMIINEAYHTLGEGVSSKQEIDLAMRTGTNYPFGPFEWADRIGIERVFRLLQRMAETGGGYDVAPSLKEEFNNPQTNL